MPTGGVYIQGLRETTRALEKAGVAVEDLKEVMGGIASEAAQTAQSATPTRSGRLKASIRGNKAKGKAVVTFGRATVPYAGPILYGWPKRNIRGSNTIERTDAVMATRAPELFEQGIDEITRKYGLQ